MVVNEVYKCVDADTEFTILEINAQYDECIVKITHSNLQQLKGHVVSTSAGWLIGQILKGHYVKILKDTNETTHV